MTIKFNKLDMPLDPDSESKGCPGCPAGENGFCDWIGNWRECPRLKEDQYGKQSLCSV